MRKPSQHRTPNQSAIRPLDDLPDGRIADAMGLAWYMRNLCSAGLYFSPGTPSHTVALDLVDAGLATIRPAELEPPLGNADALYIELKRRGRG